MYQLFFYLTGKLEASRLLDSDVVGCSINCGQILPST